MYQSVFARNVAKHAFVGAIVLENILINVSSYAFNEHDNDYNTRKSFIQTPFRKGSKRSFFSCYSKAVKKS